MEVGGAEGAAASPTDLGVWLQEKKFLKQLDKKWMFRRQCEESIKHGCSLNLLVSCDYIFCVASIWLTNWAGLKDPG